MNGSTFRNQTTKGPLWGYLIELGRGGDGRRLQMRVRAGLPDRASAQAALEAELTDRRRGTHVDPAKTTLAATSRSGWRRPPTPARRTPATPTARSSATASSPGWATSPSASSAGSGSSAG